MKLQQLRYAVEVFRRNLNVSEAAQALFTSQPGVSKQIRLLEEELGTLIFIRSGKRIVAVTQAGMTILQIAQRVLREVQNIRNISGEFLDKQSGTLILAATHSFLRFRLPEILTVFRANYPNVQVQLKQGTPAEIVEMVLNGEADLALGKDASTMSDELYQLDCGTWQYVLVVPRGHELAQQTNLTLADVSAFPLLTYRFALSTGTLAARAFTRYRVTHHTVFESDDSEILKTYVRLGLGVALLENTAFDAQSDADLMALSMNHLFEHGTYKITLRADALTRGYVYDFMHLANPDLTREHVDYLVFSPSVEDFSI